MRQAQRGTTSWSCFCIAGALHKLPGRKGGRQQEYPFPGSVKPRVGSDDGRLTAGRHTDADHEFQKPHD